LGIAPLSRRVFLASAAAGFARASETVIDIHQHTNYAGRTDDELIAHQRAMGVTRTVLLPAGSKYGLAVGAGGNDSVVALAKRYPGRFSFFANELPDIPGARQVLEKYLKAGAIGIGEQKFEVDCDSPAIHRVAEVAEEFGVPVLLHFQHAAYNMGIERFHRVVEKHARVSFIGHAQTWWGNIDRNHDQAAIYPKTNVAPGGITDRLLSDYPNVYADLSANSGLNALLRDEDHARQFLARHQDKLMYGSDCDDHVGEGAACSGAKCLAAIRRLAPNGEITEKILYANATRVLKIRAE
jgi:predicted TIM-barrel fold metal-dependent hydrolase